MWNMSRRGFEELYEKVPSPKPKPEDAWRATGGNPRALSLLYQVEWRIERAIAELAEGKGLTRRFTERWGKWLEEAVEDPDSLSRAEAPEELVRELTARNLIVCDMYARDPWLWIDEPPPSKDLGARDREVRGLADSSAQGGRQEGARRTQVELLVLERKALSRW
jgi:hypothetical protein